MSQSRRVATVAATFALMFLVAIPSVAFAERSKSHGMTLGLAGSFVDVASQQYSQNGGVATNIHLKNLHVSLSSASLTYTLNAAVSGSAVSGTAFFSLTGARSSGEDDHRRRADQSISVVGQALLVGMVPAVGFPLDPAQPNNPLACSPNCTSEIPAFFIGVGDLLVTVKGVTTDTPNAVFLFESAYLNPFGGPIVMGTADGSIRIAATYTAQNSSWSGVQAAGVVLDADGSSIGNFALMSNLTQNLVTGSENDTGSQMVLYGFAGDHENLNSVGTFSGTSVIPVDGSFDCTSMLSAQLNAAGIPFKLPENTCLATGSISTGAFDLKHDSDKHVSGSYRLQWSVPAFGFGGTVTNTTGDEEGDGDDD